MLDKENGATRWMDVIKKETKNVRVAFQEHQVDHKNLVGYQEITCHMVFDMKLGEMATKWRPLHPQHTVPRSPETPSGHVCYWQRCRRISGQPQSDKAMSGRGFVRVKSLRYRPRPANQRLSAIAFPQYFVTRHNTAQCQVISMTTVTMKKIC